MKKDTHKKEHTQIKTYTEGDIYGRGNTWWEIHKGEIHMERDTYGERHTR